MKSERVILSFVAVLIGLLFAGGVYYVYQNYFKSHSQTSHEITVEPSPSPTPGSTGDYISLDQPYDEFVSDQRSITVKGKATKGSTIIVSTPSNDQVGISSGDGSFSLSTVLDSDTNPLYVTAIFPDGTEKTISQSITYSIQSF